jgi:hypothetical protein
LLDFSIHVFSSSMRYLFPSEAVPDGGTNVRPLADTDFDPERPLQTKRGAAQALRCGHNRVEELIRDGLLETVKLDRITRVTTRSILTIATQGIRRRSPVGEAQTAQTTTTS